MIHAGELRHRVTYQEASEASDSFGQLQPTWSDQWTAWARVRPLAGREAQVARQLRADATHAIDLRGERIIKPTGRFTWVDPLGVTRTLNISEPPRDVDGDGAHLVVVCTETPAA